MTVPGDPRAGTSVTVSATARSGLAVTLSSGSTTVCSVSGTSTVTYHTAGLCRIDANQAGNAAYAAAPQVQRSIQVALQTQTITFTPPAPGTVGGSARLSASGGGSGNAVTFSVGNPPPGVCTVSGTTVTYTAAGSCVIDANQAGTTTYAAAPQVQQTIMVNGKPQTISFTAPATGIAGGTATLTATASSGLTVVLSVGNPTAGVCSVKGTTVVFSSTGGSCIIDANQAGNATYAAAPQVERTITVSVPVLQ